MVKLRYFEINIQYSTQKDIIAVKIYKIYPIFCLLFCILSDIISFTDIELTFLVCSIRNIITEVKV